MNSPNPYAPPATNSVSSTAPETAGVRIAGALIAVLVWSAFAAWFCFGGRRFGMPVNGFGFGGMGLCLAGAPALGTLLVRHSSRRHRIRMLCLLNILGLLVFVAGVRMQQTGSSQAVWYLMYAVMGLVMMGLTFAFNLRSANQSAKGQSS